MHRGDDGRRRSAAEQERDHRKRGAQRERGERRDRRRSTANPGSTGRGPSSSRASVSSATSLRLMIVSTSSRGLVRRDALGPVDHLELVALLLGKGRGAPPARCAARSRRAPAATGSRSTPPTTSKTRRRPARRYRRATRCCCCVVPPATPITSEKFDTSPSLTPNTVARSTPAESRLGDGLRSERCDRLRGSPASRRSCGRRPPPAAPSRRSLRRRRGSGRPRPPRCAASAGSTASVPRWRARKHSARTRNGTRGCARLDTGFAQQIAPSARRDVLRRRRGERNTARRWSSAYSASPRNSAPPFTSSAYMSRRPVDALRASGRHDVTLPTATGTRSHRGTDS